MNNTRITSKVRLVSEILYSGCFEVPWHQRYYDWKVEQVSELLSDIKNALDTGKACYFLGSIMLVEAPNGRPQRINDGQQRLITLSLFIAAFCRHFAQKHPRDQSRETLALRALFNRPANETSRLAESPRYHPRIAPPKNDKSKYKQILCGQDIGTDGLLTAAWNVIDGFVQEMSLPARKDTFDFVMQKVEVSVLDVPGDADAHSVFEALNARGKSLDDVDLIRNRLYSYFSETDDAARRNTVHDSLERIGVILRHARTKVQEYFRCYLQCRYGYLQKKRLYREARLSIETAAGQHGPSDYIFDLVEGMGRSESIELFRTITSPEPSPSLDQLLPTISGKRGLTVLLAELRGYKVSHPLVFALLHCFIAEGGKGKKEKARLATRNLKNLTSFVMRTVFLAPKFEPSQFETAFANAAKVVFERADTSSLEIMDMLEENDEFDVLDDTSFIRRMTRMELRDRKKALLYLFGINARDQPGSEVLRRRNCSVEHVLPQSSEHANGWTGFGDDKVEDWVHRTGNLVVVSLKENRPGAAFNRNFAAKKNAFAGSALLMARAVAEDYDNWTPQVIENRSQQLAKKAAATWSFSRAKTA